MADGEAPHRGWNHETGVKIPPGPALAQSTAHQALRRLLGRSTAREAFCFVLFPLSLAAVFDGTGIRVGRC
jgi:hypothetical protein